MKLAEDFVHMRAIQHRLQVGFSLIESMVSLVVVSVGMIGIASLYGQGLGASRTALFRTQAVNLVADMADRIRMNRQGDVAYAGAAADNDCDAAGGATCTPAQMAAHDVFEWTAQVAQRLPNGVGAVQYTGTTPPTYTISATWEEVGLGPITHQVAIRVPGI
jgi:type IV pilus assembly protein PilV